MFESLIRIPKDRVAVLIGVKGSVKKSIEKRTGTRVAISKEGEVVISCEDNLKVYITTSIVKAIGRGFNPIVALSLWNEKNAFEIINIRDFAGKSEKKLQRIKSRLIGTKGKARTIIEKNTNTCIRVYGRTVGIIGKVEDVQVAKKALEKLIRGAPHGNVYMFIDTMKKRFE